MGCNKKLRTSETVMEEVHRQALIDRRNEIRQEAIEKLRESGLILVAQASDVVVHVVGDRLDLSYVDGKVKLAIDGSDISDAIAGVSVRFPLNDFPIVSVGLKVKPLLVRREKTPTPVDNSGGNDVPRKEE